MSDRDAPLRSLHPSVEELLALHGGELAPEEAQRIGKHADLCRTCREQMAEIASFLEPGVAEAPLDDAAVEAMWRNIAEARASGSSRPEPEAEPPLVFRPRETRWIEGLAATLLLTTLLFALAWLASWRKATVLADAELNVPIAMLEPAAFLRGGGGRAPIPPGAVLVLTPSQPPADVDHSVEILDMEGKTVWSGHGLRPTARDSFHLRLPRSLLPGSTYRLRVFAPGHAPDEEKEEIVALIIIARTG